MDSLEKPQIITHVEKSLNYTVHDVKWIPCSAKVVVLGSHPRDTGALQVLEISKGELKQVHEVSSNWNSYVFPIVLPIVPPFSHGLITSRNREKFREVIGDTYALRSRGFTQYTTALP